MRLSKKNKEIRIFTGIIRKATYVSLISYGKYGVELSKVMEKGSRVHLVQFGKDSPYLMRLLYSALPSNIEAAQKLVKNPKYDYQNQIMIYASADKVKSAGDLYADDLVEIVSFDEYDRIASSKDKQERAKLSHVKIPEEIDKVLTRSHANRIYPEKIEDLVNDDLYDTIQEENLVDNTVGVPII